MEQTFPNTGLVNAREARIFLKVGNTKFYSMLKNGELPAPIKIGKLSRWKAEDIKKFAGYLQEV